MRKLWPTRIVNRNGVATTVHKRSADETSVRRLAAPVPSIHVPEPQTLESRMQDIQDLMDFESDGHLSPVMSKLVDEATPRQLAVLDGALDEYRKYGYKDFSLVDDKHYVRQCEVLDSILRLAGEDPEYLHDLLAVRSAFASEWSCSTMANLFHLNEFIRGIRSGDDRDINGNYIPIDLSTPQLVKEATALVRFSYESHRRFSGEDYYPLRDKEEQKYNANGMWMGRVFAQAYKSESLKSLVAGNPERVGDMVDLIEEHHTSDAQTLRGLLEGVEAKPLASGYL